MGDSCPEVDDVGLSFLPPVLEVPRKRAFLLFVSAIELCHAHNAAKEIMWDR